MHGRLKIRTTEEERERKKKEQALKVKAYKAAMQLIMTKRQKQEYDDEMLNATTPILQRNPDVTTLWNIRRECVLEKVKYMNSLTEEQKTQDDNENKNENENENENEKSTEETKEIKIHQIFDKELKFTENCLPVNSKSYNIWHHRCWVLENSPQADWQNELMLCSAYLKIDERNFHTWDYRRYVADKAKISKEKELDFCTEKIKVNFSNYSSWHQRSLLLPILYPYKGEAKPKKPMGEEKLKEELEMVLTAAFTDPNDSSAWFYQRWLLGYSRPEMAVCAFRANKKKIVIAFTKPLTNKDLKITLKSKDKEHELIDWHTLNLGPSDSMLTTTLKTEIDLKIFNYIEVYTPLYRNLASKWILQKALMDWSKTENIPKQLNLNDLKQLTTLTDPQYLCIADEILLSDNLKQRYTQLKTFQDI
uniref:Geranylgeranyl transferase type-2 subunit alpha n=1 Tax=Glossina brevipalpis TaxID=37001 RepID=A0A1A9WBT8_9MUSC